MYAGSFHHSNIQDYDHALHYYRQADPWRDETGWGDDRPLHRRRKRTAGVHLGPDEQVRFRLHDTDVVVYHTDGRVCVTNWASRTTQNFAWAFTPSGVTPGCLQGYLTVDGRMYRMDHGDTLTILPDRSVDGADPWVRRVHDRKRMNQIRAEYNITSIRRWMAAANKMQPGRTVYPGDFPKYRFQYASEAERKAWLRDRANWPSLTKPCLAAVEARLAIDLQGLVVSEPVEYLTSYSQVQAYRKSWSRFGKP